LLTADLVSVRRKGNELHVASLSGPARQRATELASQLLELARGHIGRTREEFEEACAAIEARPRDRRVAAGLRKLLEDRCLFDADAALTPDELRRELFLRASVARRTEPFDRTRVLEAFAAEKGLSPEAIERSIYADLRGAHLLKEIEVIQPNALVEAYELGQAQAVLLRATRVTVDLRCSTPGAYRTLFHKLKFLRLLYRLDRRAEGGYRLEIDGPLSLFESVTKYGLALALLLPTIRECDEFFLEAHIRWGKERTPLLFRLDHDEGKDRGRTEKRRREEARAPRLTEELARLLDELSKIETPWRAAPASELLQLPGVGLCVPDLLFVHRETGECVYLEVLGFWSRAAVWRRVELVERGLKDRILFAVSQQLRVSEEALGEDQPSALYVFRRVMSARALVEKVEGLSRRRAS
jgi:predicted nuclease of restriction endonuclease-like RecB superfamily